MRSAVVVLSALALASAQICDPEVECEYTAVVQRVRHSWDFEALCQNTDYVFDDGLGHTYYANICGRAAKKCLPFGWSETYEYGVAVQSWGSVPPCNFSNPATLCNDHDGGIPTCCTEDCQVLGVGIPTITLTNLNDPTAGVNMTFAGAPPDDDDPFWCPWNPQTGSQFPRTVTFSLQCDASVQNPPAVPMVAVQNKTEDCDYLLMWASMLACPDSTALPPRPSRNPTSNSSSSLSGGSIFTISFVAIAFTYIVGGMLLTYRTERAFYCPNRYFWSGVGDSVGKGFEYVVYCGKSGGGGGGGSAAAGFIGGGGGNAGPYAAVGTTTSTGKAATGSYNAGGSYNSAPTAYTDL